MAHDVPVITRSAAIIAAVLMTTFAAGCSRHPKVTSRESQDLIKQLYTACNTRNVARLDECARRVEILAGEGKLGDAERASFSRIIAVARDGNWSKAQDEALNFARDQLR